jgi:membrane-associated phospholipid phosphatase
MNSSVLASLAGSLAALSIVSPCRAQEIRTQPSADSLASAEPEINAPLNGDVRYPRSMQDVFGSRSRVPVDVDFMRANTWKHLYLDVLHDQKPVLGYPLQLARGHRWEPFLAVAAATAGLIALDPLDSPYFRKTATFQGFNTAASGFNTAAMMGLVPAALYVVSAKRSDAYGKHTLFLAAEAVADVQIITIAMKMIDRRLRPVDVLDDRYADTWFRAGAFDGKSFPSGHTITAFALADIFAERYKGHRWVSWVAYGLAGVVGFSRLTLQAHFPSDVFAGGVLGVVIPHYIVLRR